MSMKGISSAEPDKLSRRISFHKRNNAHSGELDVFEAAVYFSGYNELSSGDKFNAAREENRRKWGILGGGRRISLDIPIRCSEQVHHLQERQEVTKESSRVSNVRHKQPSSPGGRIASFLNSLFNQAGSKKKSKLKSKSMEPEVEEEVPGGGWMRTRRRRSSMSHFMTSNRSNSTATATTTTSSSSKSMFSSSSSGFRTPPPYLNTPNKNYKQFLNYTSATTQEEDKNKTNKDLAWLDEKLKVIESLSEKEKLWPDDDVDDVDHRIKRDDDHDDGMESDSSSDLFELQNYELSRGGLPVYETTNVANIKNTHV